MALAFLFILHAAAAAFSLSMKVSLANRMKEFELRCEVNPQTFQDVADCFASVRNIKDLCTEFSFTTHPNIQAVWDASEHHHTRLYPVAVQLFYHTDLGLQHHRFVAMHMAHIKRSLQQARVRRAAKTRPRESFAGWPDLLRAAAQGHLLKVCRGKEPVSIISVPKRALVWGASASSLPWLTAEVMQPEPLRNDDLLPTLDLDDGSGGIPLQRDPANEPEELAFFRVIHASPSRQRVLQTPMEAEDMIITVHRDLFAQVHRLGPQHHLAATPVGGDMSFKKLSQFRCNPDNVLRWSKGDARFFLESERCVVNEDHIVAVTCLVRSAAWGPGGKFEELVAEPLPGLQTLREQGHVELVHAAAVIRSWRLLSVHLVSMLFPVSNPEPVFAISDAGVPDMTMYELLASLLGDGWTPIRPPRARRRRRAEPALEAEPDPELAGGGLLPSERSQEHIHVTLRLSFSELANEHHSAGGMVWVRLHKKGALEFGQHPSEFHCLSMRTSIFLVQSS